MNCILANRRKWFQVTPEPDVPDVPSVWANFNLANAKYVGSAQLSAVNTSGATKTLDCRGINVLPDGRLALGDYATNYLYIWGFADGHPFEVAHLNEKCDSRFQVSSGTWMQFNKDGTSLYFGQSGKAEVNYIGLSSPYDLSSNVGTSYSSLLGTSGGIVATASSGAMSSDGKSFLYKPGNGYSGWGSIYCRKGEVGWPAKDTTNLNYELTRFSGLGSKFDGKIIETPSTVTSLTWNEFYVSPDGAAIIFLIGGATTDTAKEKSKYAVKFVMTEAWNPSTMVYHSKLYLGDDIGLSSIPRCCCVNADGTKMLIFDYKNYKFHEYTLA